MIQQTSVPSEFKSREEYREHLRQQVLKARVPVHVGLIMDGNGRWAKERGYSRIRGHQMGARSIKRLVRFADKLGVKHISLYVFSSENWSRPRLEVVGLMKLIRAYVIRERDELHAEGVRFRHLGRREELPSGLAQDLDIAEKLTEKLTAPITK
ncbi:MAG TPA: polyprenyl diphosphate synthase [Candidatus Ozemobacteraceae bacterium]|nr:polyprenyl diphosphate synthase [Candidatus Ozemobacteraceae bacterium]